MRVDKVAALTNHLQAATQHRHLLRLLLFLAKVLA
jgi:hypothetical protein